MWMVGKKIDLLEKLGVGEGVAFDIYWKIQDKYTSETIYY